MLCDAVDPNGLECDQVTSNQNPNDRRPPYLTRDVISKPGSDDFFIDPYVSSVFTSVACYNGSNDPVLGDDLTRCIAGDTTQRHFLCCHKARTP